MIRRLAPVPILIAGVVIELQAQTLDANKVMADMRAAIGGADKIAAVRTVTVDGATRTPMGTSTVLSEVNLAIALPDKYVARRMLTPTIGVAYRESGFNGDGLIDQTEVAPDPSRRILIRTPGRVWPSGPLTDAQRAAELRDAKRDFARMALVLFGSSFEAFPLQFSYAGQENVADAKAHVIQVTGADGFEARLFVDSKSNRPVMMTWEDFAPFVATSTTREGYESDPGAQRQQAAFIAQWDQNEAARKVVEYRVQYSNFKLVDGLNLPHTLTRMIDGKAKDATTFEVIRINPSIEAARFATRVK